MTTLPGRDLNRQHEDRASSSQHMVIIMQPCISPFREWNRCRLEVPARNSMAEYSNEQTRTVVTTSTVQEGQIITGATPCWKTETLAKNDIAHRYNAHAIASDKNVIMLLWTRVPPFLWLSWHILNICSSSYSRVPTTSWNLSKFDYWGLSHLQHLHSVLPLGKTWIEASEDGSSLTVGYKRNVKNSI